MEESRHELKGRARFLGALAVALVVAVPLAADQRPCSSPPPVLKGAWAQPGGTLKLDFEAERVVVLRKEGDLRVAGILSRGGPCQLVVRDEGFRSTWTVTGDEHALQLDLGKGPAVNLVPLAGDAASLDLTPMSLPPAAAVPPEKAKEVSAELDARLQRDQDALAKGAKDLWPKVARENLTYLRGLAGQYGWIDTKRFGKHSAAVAIVLLKHSGDLPLMEAALPVVEHDDNGPQIVAILTDELLIATGHRQRYGTQLGELAGKPCVVPIEDLPGLAERRRHLGLPPLADYLAEASKVLYDGAPIRIPGPDE
jgi:hypothetical protein